MPDDLAALTLAELAERLSSGELSSVEVTRASLERIDALNPLLNAFISVQAEAALAAAHQAEEEIGAGGYRGPLHGVPLALKDLYHTAGVATTAGSAAFAGFTPDHDATVAAKLRTAGAILIGKLNLNEIALGTTGLNNHFGPARNPWNPQHMPGGSSSGPGVAVAAGMVYGAVGSDTGGSIRIPAALCGITGLKPNLRVGEPLRRDAAVLVARPRGTHSAHGGGLRPAPSGHGRIRPPLRRLHLPAPPWTTGNR